MFENLIISLLCGMAAMMFVIAGFGINQAGDYDKLNLECARAGGIGENVSTSIFDDAKIECRRDVPPLYVK